MTEDQLRNLSVPVRTFEYHLLRVMVREHDRRSAVMRGLVDSSPFEPWRICSPEDLKAWLKAHPIDPETGKAIKCRKNRRL